MRIDGERENIEDKKERRQIRMSNMGSSLLLPRTAEEADEGVAIPRCALMASSSLEVLENSSVITFSSDRRQRDFMGTDRPETSAIFYTLLNALLTLHWQSEKIVLRANRLSILRRSNRPRFICWYKFLVQISFARIHDNWWFYFLLHVQRNMSYNLLLLFKSFVLNACFFFLDDSIIRKQNWRQNFVYNVI